MAKFETLIGSEIPVLIDYYATWCGPCKAMHPVLEELKKRTGDRLKIVKINIDSPENRQNVQAYQVRSVPTLMLFKNGQLLWRQSGAVGAEQLAEIVGKYLNA